MTWWGVVLSAILVYSGLVLAYFFASNTQYLVLMLGGFARTRSALKTWHWGDLRWLMQSLLTPPISVIAPAYNEEANIVHSIRSLLMLHYPQFEVVVVNDGSADATLQILIREFSLRPVARRFDLAVSCRPIRPVYESREYPTLVAVDKENGGGKADALNAGLNVALYPLFCAIDAGSVLEDEALLRVVRLHRRLRGAGRRYRIRFVPDAVCWTEAPTTLRVLRGQRKRWQRGLMDTLWRHRAMLGVPRYGIIGLVSMPCFLLFELLGPPVELTGDVMALGCLLFGLVDTRFFAAFLGVMILYSILTALTAVLLEDVTFRRHPRLWHLIVLALAGVMENLGYRQINMWWRTLAFWDCCRGSRSWGNMERRGVGKS